MVELGVGPEGVVHFSARPLAALSGSFTTGSGTDSIRIAFTERPPAASDTDALRLALRCLALLAARAAAIERAGARAEPPPDFLCPITLAVMRDPAAAADGHTYERSAITEWLAQRRSSPLTNCPVSTSRLEADDALRRRIDRWVRETLGPDALTAAPAAPAAPEPARRAPPPAAVPSRG